MKMAVRDPILRVMIGPYLSLSFCKSCSTSSIDFVSHSMFPMMESEVGPGGRWGLVGLSRERRGLMRAEMQMVRVRMMMSQVSIVSGDVYFF